MVTFPKGIYGSHIGQGGFVPLAAAILVKVKEMYGKEKDVTVTDIDGVKLDFPDKWVHLRKSNTEPIIRVYSEASTMEQADELGKKLMQVVYDMQ